MPHALIQLRFSEMLVWRFCTILRWAWWEIPRFKLVRPFLEQCPVVVRKVFIYHQFGSLIEKTDRETWCRLKSFIPHAKFLGCIDTLNSLAFSDLCYPLYKGLFSCKTLQLYPMTFRMHNSSNTRNRAKQIQVTAIWVSSREMEFMRWSPVAFLTNGIFISTRVGLELTTHVLWVRKRSHYTAEPSRLLASVECYFVHLIRNFYHFFSH